MHLGPSGGKCARRVITRGLASGARIPKRVELDHTYTVPQIAHSTPTRTQIVPYLQFLPCVEMLRAMICDSQINSPEKGFALLLKAEQVFRPGILG